MDLRPARVLVDGREILASPAEPLVFGRADAPGVIGLDARDNAISAVAGAVEASRGLWWIVNRSSKRRLLLEDETGASYRLEPSLRFAITSPRTLVVVPGEILQHRIEVLVDEADLSAGRSEPATPTDTVSVDDIRVSDRDREALVALCSGFLASYPRRRPHPLTYQEAADLLGPPWTRVTVRKQIERFRERLARTGVYFDGAQANYELADYLTTNGVIGPADLTWLESRE